VHGRTAHATAPHLGVDATVISARLVTALQSIASPDAELDGPVVLSVVNIHGGPEAFGTSIVDKVKLDGILRAESVGAIMEIRDQMQTIADRVAEGTGGSCDIDFLDGCPEGINDAALSKLMIATGKKVLGEDKVVVEPDMRLGGEDFTFFAEQVPSCFIYLGAQVPGTSSSLHTPTAVVDEAAIPAGVKLMCQVAVDYLAP